MNEIEKIIKSWATKKSGINSLKYIFEWIDEKNKSITVNIQKKALSNDSFWFIDEERGEIRNKNNSFFRIKGLQKIKDGVIIHEQPIIIQNEIGYLGIICSEIEGVMHFLMQAKIEPGNINKVQISPTVQATRSNFTQKHGGNKPAYVDYFINAHKHMIIVDQLQSEQASRFYKKRNRNIIIKVSEEIEVLPSHIWLTLGQIKELLKVNNLVNMDTRTVISCIPFYQASGKDKYFKDKSLYNSIFKKEIAPVLTSVYNKINNYKMFDETVIDIVPLTLLKSWYFKENEIICQNKAEFKVIFCDVEIEGREVKRWSQPLFEAIDKATFGLFTCNDNGVMKFLVKLTPEVGCCDKVELGPTIQLNYSETTGKIDEVTALFISEIETFRNIKYDVLLSEEGGRFYHEENRNIIIEIDRSMINNLPDEYLWLDFRVLNKLTQINNCINIQLRNLLSLLEV